MKNLVNISLLLWLVTFFCEYTTKSVDGWRQSARKNYTGLQERVAISPGTEFSREFDVNYSVSHFIGLVFDDQNLNDSLYSQIGMLRPTDFGFRLKWIVYENGDSIAGGIISKSNGQIGDVTIIGKFDASTFKDYVVSLKCLSLPPFVINDSCILEVGVNEASVSIGNELIYGTIELLANKSRVPLFILSSFLTIITIGLFVRNKRKNANVG